LTPNKIKIASLAIPILLFSTFLLNPCFSISQKNIAKLYLQGDNSKLLKLASKISPKYLNPLDNFLLGKYLYKNQQYEKSIIFLKKSITTDSLPFKDHAIFWLGKALSKIDNSTEALKQFKMIYNNFKSSIYTQKALQKSSQISYRFKKDFNTLTLLKKELKICRHWEKSRILFHIAEIQFNLGMKKQSTRSLYKLIRLRRHNKYDRKATRWLLRTASKYHPANTKQRILYYEALIRNKKDNLALYRLKKLRQTAISEKNKFEIDLDIIWLLRRKRLWNSALYYLNRLNKKTTIKSRKLRLYKHYFRIQMAQSNIKSAERIIKKIKNIAPKKVIYYYKQISKALRYNNKLSFNYNLKFSRMYPYNYYFKNKLIRLIIKDYSSRKYSRVLRRAKTFQKQIHNNEQKATLYYYTSEAATKLRRPAKTINRLRLEVIKAQPLGFYHSQFIKKNKIPQITIRTNGLENKKLQELTVLYLLSNDKDKKKTRGLIKKLWDISNIKKNIDSSFNFNRYLSFIPRERNKRFLFFWDKGLYKEAYLEFDYFRKKKRKRLNSYNPRDILFIARLARKANLTGTSIYYYNKFIYLSGWGKELSIIDRNFQKTPIELIYPQNYNHLVTKNSKKYNLDKLFIFSLIKQESGFTHDIQSWAGAIGLMQIMPATGRGIARKLGIKNHNLKNADDNIKIGSSFLSWLKRKFGHESEMLIGYNAGPNRVKQWKRRFIRRYRTFNRDAFIEFVPYIETRNYIKKVFSNMAVYKYLYGKKSTYPKKRL